MPDYPIPDMKDVELVDILQAVADPIRLHILALLADGEPHAKTVEEWGVEITKSTMSYHFKALREAGLTRTLIDGRKHDIQLRRAELDDRFPGLIAALTDRGARPTGE
ncbi:MAG: ArsR family transcriptional regulator [Frondihabitans sp.]|nr:ArsR family transcriptional regulator [Frondihabitans sp.]